MTDAISDVEGMLAGRVGLRLDPALRARLTNCVEEEAAAAGMTIETYAAAVESDSQIFQGLLNRVTVQQTSFFRDPSLFSALATEVLPNLSEPIQAWSAGCANGQEAYTMAMILEESGLREWEVVASDISTRALQRATDAAYLASEVTGLGEERLRRHMRPAGNRWEVLPHIKERVQFVRHNLIDDELPVSESACQIILCRNVLIYFTPAQLSKVLDRLAGALDPSGCLCLGASESLWQLSDRFRLTRLGPAFVYRLSEAPLEVERRRLPDRRQALRDRRPDRRQPPTVAQLLAEGEAAAAANDYSRAAQAFRRATYIDPERPVSYFQLALCLERAGLTDAAQRALLDARDAVQRCDTSRLEAALEGYRPDELMKAIDIRLGGSGR